MISQITNRHFHITFLHGNRAEIIEALEETTRIQRRVLDAEQQAAAIPNEATTPVTAHMVNLLNDETFCANIRAIGYSGRDFFPVIRDIATGLAARGVKA